MAIPSAVAPYYRAITGEHRETILEMRRRILEVAPKVDEVIKYGMPTFMLDGNEIAGLLSNKNHIGYYPYSGSVINRLPEVSERYVTTKGAIHIPLGEPMPKTFIKKLIKARIAQCPVSRGEVDLTRYEKLDGDWKTLGVASPARRGLVDKKLLSVRALSKITESDFMKIHGMGPKAAAVLKVTFK